MSIKSNYDSSCATWDPNGKLFQVEYAMRAVNLGSICVGLRNKTHAVLLTIKRSQSKLSGYQQKVFKIDDNMGMAIAGLNADARVLCKFMRNECLNHKYIYESAHPLNRLIEKIAEKSQAKTQSHHSRPYGVGLLMAGYDQDGPHIIQTCPSGNYYEYYAYSIGVKNQAARTYFEEHLHLTKEGSLDDLVIHGLKALQKAVQDDEDLSHNNVEIAIVGKDTPFVSLQDEELKQWIEKAQLQQNDEDQMEEEVQQQ